MNNQKLLVVGDSDALIATLHGDDQNHSLAKELVETFVKLNVRVVFPITTIAETVTTLKRKFNSASMAAEIINQVTQQQVLLCSVDEIIFNSALNLFNPAGSKQHTIFDAIVAATAKRNQADYVFAFDKWYTKHNLKLAQELL